MRETLLIHPDIRIIIRLQGIITHAQGDTQHELLLSVYLRCKRIEIRNQHFLNHRNHISETVSDSIDKMIYEI